jgi:hypothetical protein
VDPLIAEKFKHADVISLVARLLQDESGGGNDYGVGTDYERGVGDRYRGGVLGYCYLVDVDCFL